MTSGEKIIGSMPVYDFDKEKYVTIFTKLGMVKRTKLSDFKVGRYTKEIGMIKLQDGDTVVSVTDSSLDDVMVVTRNGYGLWYDVAEVSVVGIRASGVKAIKLKDDEVVAGMIFDPRDEYITIVTDKGTAKRLKLNNIEKTSRANRGILLMKEIKSNPSKIIDSYIMSSKEELVVTSIKEEKTIKLTEIAIMDRQSNGSFIVRDRILGTHKLAVILENTQNESNKQDNGNVKKSKTIENDKEYKTLSGIDKKIEMVDSLLDNIEDK